jgi:hypothetical protein
MDGDDLTGEDLRAKEICTDLYGSCSCFINQRRACKAMLALAENDEDASDERNRINESMEQSDGQ